LKEKSFRHYTLSADETIRLGERLGRLLTTGDVVALVGDLGSGKTWFTKGLALGMGVPSETVVTSPTFALVNEYEGRLNLFHMDAYRLDSVAGFVDAGLDEYFYEEGVVALEWADRWPELLPNWTVLVEIALIDDHSREITLSGHHRRAHDILQKMGNT
jgi:tRNA threonylcarbamoyladenosine biosynthesis protein TsaE